MTHNNHDKIQRSALRTSKVIEVRFSEVDTMRVAWHGNYALYFEDAREAFGREHGLGYETYIDNNTFAPLVDLSFRFLHPLRFGEKARVDIYYCPTEAAKVVFDYEIRSIDGQRLHATGRSVQVFMDMNYELMWDAPEFYTRWKREHGF